MNLKEEIQRIKQIMGLNESIDKTAGVWDTNEKFDLDRDWETIFM